MALDAENLEDTLLPPAETTESAPPAGGTSPQQQVSEQSQTPALPAGLLDRAKQAGLPLDGIDSESKLAEFVLDRYMQDRAYADYGRSALSQNHPQKGGDNNQLKDNAPQDGLDAEKQFDLDGHFGSLWNTPQLDEAAKFAINNGIVQLGEDGLYQAKPGYESMALPLLNSLNQAHISQREQMQRLFEGNFYQNIDKGLWPAVEHRVQKMLEERLSQQFQTYEQTQAEQTFEEKFKNEHKAWLYDASGNLTPDGKKFSDTVAELREQGITDVQKLAKYAMQLAAINPQAAPATPAAQAEATKQRDEHGRFLPAGKPAPVAPPQSKQESFLDKARKNAALSENRSTNLNNNPAYEVANEGELENMFSTAYRQLATA